VGDATTSKGSPTPATTPLPSRRLRPTAHGTPSGRRLLTLSLTALGVVYGDIGTSPLYALRECFKPAYGLRPDVPTVYGVLSLIVWALIVIVGIKYVVFIMRLDNRGEGGILALLALALRLRRLHGERAVHPAVIALGLFGAALLYGDGVITPAISVLSAIEGLEVATPALAHLVVPLTLVILFLLFHVQKYGTARLGGVFGPVMVVWFGTIAVLGTVEILHAPRILLALNPWYALRFFFDHGRGGFLVLGAVVLAVTGAEALYADMGHFGRRPIRLVWLGFVLPALLLNYFGQGALLLRVPDAVQSPFYLLAPRLGLYPLVVIATVATIVASQALISGAFSLTQQCVQLRFCPRLPIVHTSRAQVGQIYMPDVNAALMCGCLLLVLGFRSSGALSAAYGVAVTGTMAITSVLFYIIAHRRWRWSRLRAGGLVGVFLVIDLAFLAANVVKIEHGGWVPLVIAGGVFLVMTTWNRGARIVSGILSGVAMPLDRFLAEVERTRPPRVPGTAVFLTPGLEGAPLVLIRHLRLNKALHEEIVLLSILTEEVPEVRDDARIEVEHLPAGFHRVKASYGFMERPHVQEIIALCGGFGMRATAENTTYYLGRPQLLPTGTGRMMHWRKRLFAFMERNAGSAADFFGLPPNRVVELGARIEF
jgi:KUP system potassium uptake protein